MLCSLPSQPSSIWVVAEKPSSFYENIGKPEITISPVPEKNLLKLGSHALALGCVDSEKQVTFLR